MLLVQTLTVPDTIVLVVCLIVGIRGAFKGFVWQAIRTAGLIGALWAATRFHEPIGRRLDEWFSFLPTFATPVVAWLLILVGIFLVFAFLAYMARGAMKTANLTGVDRVLGLAMGAVMGLCFCAIAFVIWGFLFLKTDSELEKALEGSQSARFMAKIIEVVDPLFPEGVRERFGASLKAIEAAGESGTAGP
ncbi:MAG: CvpA family protein [Planctomycetota bacterium]|nr:CvpA family protein [Planctomycetota bacterium]